MAQTKILTIKTSDSSGASVTYNIDNPKNIPDPLTRASIAGAFQYGIDNSILISSKGYPISSIDQISVTTSEKVIIDGETVYVNPSSIEIVSNQTQSETVTINTSIQAASYFRTSQSIGFDNIVTSITQNTINQSQVLIEFTQPNDQPEEGYLRIVVNGRNINIPVTISESE